MKGATLAVAAAAAGGAALALGVRALCSALPDDRIDSIDSQVANAFISSKVLYSLTQLGVADALAAGPLSVAELAAAERVKAGALARLLRAAAALGFFREVSPGVWANNRLSGMLRSDYPHSTAPIVLHMGDESYRGHELMYEALAEGAPSAFELRHKKGYWEWLASPGQEEVEARFNSAMAAHTKLVMGSVAQDYPWARHAGGRVIDVGGGTGTALAAVLRAHPSLHGIVFDLAQPIAEARNVWAEQFVDLLPRVEFSAGSFFDASSIPSGDCYFLKHILHDWSDSESLRILRALRQAIPPGNDATLLVCEYLVDDNDPAFSTLTLDLQMLSLVDGKERTRREWAELLAGGGFELVAVHTLRARTCLLEARPI
eukprot:scaffold10.g2357.t1